MDLVAALRRQHGCLSLEQARAGGLSDESVRRDLRRGTLRSIHRGVLVHPVYATVSSAPAAAWLSQVPSGQPEPGVALSHHTAAAMWQLAGCPTSHARHLTVPRDWLGRQRPGVRLHRSRLPAMHLIELDGLPVTSAAWTVLSLARILRRAPGLVVLDAALRDRQCTLAELRAALPLLDGLRGCVQARALVDLARQGTDSAMESISRLVLVDAGLPVPDVDLRIVDEFGRLLARGDLGYRLLLVWIEYDGYDVHTERTAFRLDRSRQNWLQARGWQVLRFSDAALRYGGAQMVRDVRQALLAAPARIAALPAGLSPEADAARAAGEST